MSAKLKPPGHHGVVFPDNPYLAPVGTHVVFVLQSRRGCASRLPADQTGPTSCAPDQQLPRGGPVRTRHIPNQGTQWPPLAAGCRASYAYALEVRDISWSL